MADVEVVLWVCGGEEGGRRKGLGREGRERVGRLACESRREEVTHDVLEDERNRLEKEIETAPGKSARGGE